VKGRVRGVESRMQYLGRAARGICPVVMDTLSPSQRSERMSRVRGKHTAPELAVRRELFSMGYRYRLHCAKLPGRPDIVLAGRRKVIFVNGCFWHLHVGCKAARLPKSNIDFWRTKLRENASRDRRNRHRLTEDGWSVLTIWQCQVDAPDLCSRLAEFLRASKSNAS